MYYEPKRGFPFNIPRISLNLFITASKKFYVGHGGEDQHPRLSTHGSKHDTVACLGDNFLWNIKKIILEIFYLKVEKTKFD